MGWGDFSVGEQIGAGVAPETVWLGANGWRLSQRRRPTIRIIGAAIVKQLG